jgi:hypothetical protein
MTCFRGTRCFSNTECHAQPREHDTRLGPSFEGNFD